MSMTPELVSKLFKKNTQTYIQQTSIMRITKDRLAVKQLIKLPARFPLA